ncbi:MAG: PCRF domain-containing protein, partial [Acutalibacteraceae bacterium]
MFENLSVFENRYEELNLKLYDPTVAADRGQYAALMKEHKEITPIVEQYRALKKAEADMEGAQQLLDDPASDRELRQMAAEELNAAREDAAKIAETLKVLLLPRDPNDERSVIVEIRGGAGGEEAALFAYNLYRMYTMYAERRGWKTEIVGLNETELGGFKEVSFTIDGDGAYSRLKFE